MRSKLILVMASLVFIMASVFYTISYGYVRTLFQQYAVAAKGENAEQWARLLAYYYQSHGNSFTQADSYVRSILASGENALTGNHVETVIVMDGNQKRIVFVDQGKEADDIKGSDSESENDLEPSTKFPITVHGHVVGTVYVTDAGAQSLWVVEERVLHSMTLATFLGVLLTSIAALIAGVWWSKKLTQPLFHLLSAIERIVRGEETARVDIQSNDEFGRVGQAFNDMTGRLLQTENARKHLVADVAHELRTPLTIMQGQLELAQQSVMPMDEKTLLSMLDEVMRLSRLVDDLQQLSLAEIGALHLEKVQSNLVALLSRILENFSIEAEEHSITLAFHSIDDEVVLFIDSNRITQVFVNLLGNALRHTPDGGEIRLEVRKRESFIEISVEDTGNGIEPRHISYIFDRFYRVNEDRSRETGGMGIGLAIAKEYVEAHYGSIEVVSRLGIGTKFTVKLPIQG